MRGLSRALPNEGQGAGGVLGQGDIGASRTAQQKATFGGGTGEAQQFGGEGAVPGPGLGGELSLREGRGARGAAARQEPLVGEAIEGTGALDGRARKIRPRPGCRKHQAVHINFQVGVAGRPIGCGARRRVGGTDAVGRRPIVGDAVPAGVGEGRSGRQGPVAVVSQARVGLVRVDRSRESQRGHVPDHEVIDGVPGKGAAGFHHAGVEAHLATGSGGRAQRRDRRGRGRPGRAKHGDAAANGIVGRPIEDAVLVAIHIIAGGIDALVGVELEIGVARAGGAGPGDEIVAHDVVGKDAPRVGHRIGRLEVVDDVVDVLGVGFGQRLAVVGVDPEVAVEGIGPDLHMGAELLSDGIGDDTVLHREIGYAHSVHAVKLPVLERAMVQDDITPVAHVDGALAGIRILVALSETDIADDDIAFPAKRYFGRHKTNAAPGGCLALDGKVAAHRNRRQEDDVSSHVEHDDTVARADGIPKGPRSRIIQIGDMVDRPAPAAGGRGPKPERSGESHDLRPRRGG